MIDHDHGLSLLRQANALGISRSSVYYQPRPISAADLALMRRIDELHLDYPFAPLGHCCAIPCRAMGSRILKGLLNSEGHEVGRCHVATLMKRMGIAAIYRRPNTSKPAPGHKVYPCLLRNLAVTRPNQAWDEPSCAIGASTMANDITYIPPLGRLLCNRLPFCPAGHVHMPERGQWMARGFVYLVAVVDWFSRRILAWRVSITLSADFCIEALEEALRLHGKPEIFNSDQGAQFTSFDFTQVLKDAQIAISMPLGDCEQSPAGERRQGCLARQRLR